MRWQDVRTERWSAPLATSEVRTLPLIAAVADLAAGTAIVVAPYLSARPTDERSVYGALGLALVAKAVALLFGRSWRAAVIRAAVIWADVAVVVALLLLTSQVGVLPVLLVFPVLTVAYFGSRLESVALIGALGLGLAAVRLGGTDPRFTWFAWMVMMLVCITSGLTVRLIAERADLLMRRLDERARRDVVTGLLNRRGFDDTLDELWAVNRPALLAVVFFDLDHFKRINDTHGHAIGDQVLQAFSRALAELTGPTEVVGRTGGEEFAVAMPGSGVRVAAQRAAQVVEHVAALQIPCAGELVRLTVSAGVAERLPRHTGPSDLCRDADRALYEAKDAGRNQAVVASRR